MLQLFISFILIKEVFTGGFLWGYCWKEAAVVCEVRVDGKSREMAPTSAEDWDTGDADSMRVCHGRKQNWNQIRKISFWKFSTGTQHNLSSGRFGVWEDSFLLLKDTHQPASYTLQLVEASSPTFCLCPSSYIVLREPLWPSQGLSADSSPALNFSHTRGP